MSAGRFALFLIVVLTIWAAMHAYVFWRAASVPWVAARVSRLALILAAVGLWATYPLARIFDAWKLETLAWPFEFAGANWIGVLFLLCAALLLTDFVTLGGWVLTRWAPVLRGWGLVAAGALSVVALAQGLRSPVVRDYEVTLSGLPPERDGVTLVWASDMHLNRLIGERWMRRVVARFHALRPDLVVVGGDLVDVNVGHLESLAPVLRDLRAPLGVWAVTGNHEYYAGVERCVRLMEEVGYTVLRDRWAEVAPGLVLGGVDDLTARREFGPGGSSVETAVERALANRPAGAAILVSHSPLEAPKAAALGAGLMISGHTHNGQIWPFTYLVRLRYALMAGRYEVAGMPVIVCRGTGTWGPRMRLWRRSEILRIRLRAYAEGALPPASAERGR